MIDLFWFWHLYVLVTAGAVVTALRANFFSFD
jgi:hypothetical protein